MKIAIATTCTPFIHGGGELQTENLLSALRKAGHQVDVASLPFRFSPAKAVLRSMDFWEGEDFDTFNAGPVDLVIAEKFPAFYLTHSNKVVWLMHQHRSVYELWDTPFGDSSQNSEANALRKQIAARDTHHLSAARRVFTTSERVSERMAQYNGVGSKPVLHPPPSAEDYFYDQQLPYILVPSRLEALKRQDLAIRALNHANPAVKLVITGQGGLERTYSELVEKLDLVDRVMFTGHTSREQLITWYANALAVYFGPFDEDYGYVTLEAMLSHKPVITCVDSGGPLSFVVDGETGLICDPSPEAVAAAFDRLWSDRRYADNLGRSGHAHYRNLNFDWENVVRILTE